jgi:hypothetical protein
MPSQELHRSIIDLNQVEVALVTTAATLDNLSSSNFCLVPKIDIEDRNGRQHRPTRVITSNPTSTWTIYL